MRSNRRQLDAEHCLIARPNPMTLRVRDTCINSIQPENRLQLKGIRDKKYSNAYKVWVIISVKFNEQVCERMDGNKNNHSFIISLCGAKKNSHINSLRHDHSPPVLTPK